VAFVTQAFATAGMTTIVGENIDNPETALAAFAASGSQTAVICAGADLAANVVAEFAAELKNRGAHRIVVSGRAGEHETVWRGAGVTSFLYPGCDLLSLLGDVLDVERVGS